MKKILALRFLTIIFVVLFVFSSVALADQRKNIKVFKTHNAVTIAAGGSSTSAAIPLDEYRPDGYFSIQVDLSGDGTAKFEYLLSNDEVTYIDPTGATDIGSGLTKTGGVAGDGTEHYSFSPELAKSMKIIVTETGSSSSVTVTVTLAIQ